MNYGEKWSQLDDFHVAQVLDNEELCPSVKEENTGDYEEDKVSAHRLQVFGNFPAAAVMSVAYCQHLSHF